ncbi:uncharacterized protein LOC114463683 [Gouania willdenowi]|uniref:uncharacterized protein LOC114463683 n=1 Tax=Gouania willdenowi TaxID=441366 RepID=UPI001054C9D8|nr:uncharacterized protein LOC114463683 [Gouania willdenowi]XP_028303192.1 uncharacterized protein LOC114463683 [Gouania willdenowi]
MVGVLEVAVGLCLCKLALSLFYLPSLTKANSAISFCCCCLLMFTDFSVTVFLTFLSIFGFWLPGLAPSGDVIALRFLLFLGNTYRAVLLLITPLIAVETLARHLWPHTITAHRTLSSYDGKVTIEVEEEEEEEDNSDLLKDTRWSLAFSYFCCLSVWVLVALNVNWKWQTEELLAMACSYTASSVVGCLPKLLSPCLCMTLLFLFLLLLIITLQKQSQAAAQTDGEENIKIKGENHWNDIDPASSEPLKSVKAGMLEYVDLKMASGHHGDPVIASSVCLSGKREEQENERRKEGIQFTFITETHVDSHLRIWSWWRRLGFPFPEAKVIIAWMGVLCILVIPPSLSVNVLLIRTIETLLEECIEFIGLLAENRGHASPSDIEIQV